MMARTMNQKSLENLKKPKRYKSGHGYRYAVPVTTINNLFQLLSDGMTLKKASDKCDICYETAKKYFEKGDDKRGIKPLKMRLVQFQSKVDKKFEEKLLDKREEYLGIIDDVVEKLKGLLDNGVLLEKASLTQLKSYMELSIKLRGGVTEVHEETMFTAEQLADITGTEEKSD